jgi:serine/threonine protein kinase
VTVVSTGDRIVGSDAEYDVEEVLGRGGWAVVYRAHDGDGRVVALKVLNEQHRRPDQLARLRREFEFARQLDHPNIVTVYECGQAWLAMELISGGTVAHLSGITARLSALTQIAAALDYAHRLGIVHSDVKPSNILVTEDASRAVLIDFGVAHSLAADVAARLSQDPTHRLTLDPARRITHRDQEPPAQVQASLVYSAPELLTGRAISAATDEYSLACTTVELLTGHPPFTADTPLEMIDHQLHSPPPRISVHNDGIPHAVDSILAKAMAKSPDRRYGSCAEFIALIAHALQDD